MIPVASVRPAYCRLVWSAQSFHQYFRGLNKAGGSLSPIERLVFSLVMANTKPAPAAQQAPAHRG